MAQLHCGGIRVSLVLQTMRLAVPCTLGRPKPATVCLNVMGIPLIWQHRQPSQATYKSLMGKLSLTWLIFLAFIRNTRKSVEQAEGLMTMVDPSGPIQGQCCGSLLDR